MTTVTIIILSITICGLIIFIAYLMRNNEVEKNLYDELHEISFEERENLKHDYEDQIRQLNFKVTYCNDSLKNAEEQIESQSVMEDSLKQTIENLQNELKKANALIVKLDSEKTQSKTTKPKKVKNAS